MSKIEEVAKLVEIGKAKLVGKAVQEWNESRRS